jgi:hypothetical protein
VLCGAVQSGRGAEMCGAVRQTNLWWAATGTAKERSQRTAGHGQAHALPKEREREWLWGVRGKGKTGQGRAKQGKARRDKDSDSVGVRRRDGGRWAPNRGGTWDLDLGLVTCDFGRGRESVAAVTQRRRPFGAEQAGSEVWLVTSCVAEVGQPGRASLGAAVQPGQQDRRDRAGGTGWDWLGLAGTGWVGRLGRVEPVGPRAGQRRRGVAVWQCGSGGVAMAAWEVDDDDGWW